MTPAPSLQELIDTVAADAADDDPLALLAQASATVAELESVGDAVLGHFVDQCRVQGRTWSEISKALGVTRQAVHKRFSASQPTFERFTPRARLVLRAASTAAAAFGDQAVGDVHLLLGLYDQSEGVAALVLGDLGVTPDQVVAALGRRPSPNLDAWLAARPADPPQPADPGLPPSLDRLPYSSEAKQTLLASVAEALGLGHNYIGTEHLLLALMADPDRPTARLLAGLGADHDQVRARVADKLSALLAARDTPPNSPA